MKTRSQAVQGIYCKTNQQRLKYFMNVVAGLGLQRLNICSEIIFNEVLDL